MPTQDDAELKGRAAPVANSIGRHHKDSSRLGRLEGNKMFKIPVRDEKDRLALSGRIRAMVLLGSFVGTPYLHKRAHGVVANCAPAHTK